MLPIMDAAAFIMAEFLGVALIAGFWTTFIRGANLLNIDPRFNPSIRNYISGWKIDSSQEIKPVFTI